MATITLMLKKRMTRAEDDQAMRLLADALMQDGKAVSRRMEKPVIKKLLRRGVLKFSRDQYGNPK